MAVELAISSYEKVYHNELILSVPSFRLSAGVYWLKGINGSGKSTFLRSIAGLLPFDGAIEITTRHGNRLECQTDRTAYRKYVNYAYAEPHFPPYLSGKELLDFIGKAKGASAGQVAELAAQLGSNSYYSQPMSTYSSGMLKKIALISAFLGEPDCILLDEPYTTIDTQAGHMLNSLIRQRLQKGCLLIIASHQLLDMQAFPVNGDLEIINRQLTRL